MIMPAIENLIAAVETCANELDRLAEADPIGAAETRERADRWRRLAAAARAEVAARTAPDAPDHYAMLVRRGSEDLA